MPKFDTLTAPAAWSSYLVNGDASGLSAFERASADAWRAQNQIKAVLDLDRYSDGEAHPQRWLYDLSIFAPNYPRPMGGDVLDYVVQLLPDAA